MEDKMRIGEIQRKFGLLAIGLLVAFPGLARADVKFNFNTIDVPICGPLKNAPCQTGLGNISNNDVIVGTFWEDGGPNNGDAAHGFILRGGVYTAPIDEPNAAVCPSGPVSGSGFNGSNEMGLITGTYADKSCTTGHAFVLSGNTFTTLDPVGVRSQGGGINAQGQVVGTYRTKDQKRHGFLWRSGSFILPPPTDPAAGINVPNDDPFFGTVLYAINDLGQIAGTYVDMGGNRHGFFRDSAGNYTTLDAPGAILTTANGINNSGKIVGMYVDASGHSNGFFLSGAADHANPGAWTTINVRGATDTIINSINDAGLIAGGYFDENGATHGLVGTPEQ
jgi:probable HAF family extracellular repeat protein